MFKQIVAHNLIRLRKERNWKREDLACFAHIEFSHLGACERGENNLKLSTLRRLADAFGLPLSRMFNEGTPLDPDYTSLTYFIRATVPYFWELEKVYDPLQLLDFTGDLLLGNVTLQDMDEAVSLYKQKLIYTPFRHKQRLKESAPYYTTGIRLEYRHGAFHQILREERDVWQAYEAVAELTQRMNDGKLDPIHLNDVIEDFCALKATPF